VASAARGSWASTRRSSRASRLLLGAFVLLACAEKTAPPAPARDRRPVVETHAEMPSPRRPAFENAYAQIPPQCYVKTRRGDRVNNSCAVCHRASLEPNFVDDAELQLSYALPPSAHRNPYTNLLAAVDRAVAEVDDGDVLAYVRRGNYRAPGETSPVAAGPPAARDGYVPDAHFRFDERGFDRDASGVATGWRAFAYEPLPGGFGPELGSFGDVLIRLPPAFRTDRGGAYDEETYIVNLAVVEALIRRADVAIDAVDERRHGVDLDGDGALDIARRVHFRFDRSASDNLCFVGGAFAHCATSKPAPGLYPLGTEFLHSLRYLDVTQEGVVPASRMKELRYAKKTRYLSYAELRNEATHEAKERAESPDRPRRLLGDEMRGVANGQGWTYRAFIEDERGELRTQSTEEHLSCVGCHGGVGVTTDSSFAFPRKIRGRAAGSGWVHQLAPERNALPGAPTLPSKERALALDKLYWSIVKAQSFAKGRGPVTTTPDELWAEVPVGELTGVAVRE
jgi:hypothetical protein